MNAFEYAYLRSIATREGGLANVLNELAKNGALDTAHDDNGKRWYAPRSEECQSQ